MELEGEPVSNPFKGKVLYHGGPPNQRFDFDKLMFSTKADSGRLGYFFAPDKLSAQYYAGKTGEIREFQINSRKPYTMTEDEYRKYGSASAFARRREDLVSQGYDAVYIPHMDEYVALKPEVIKPYPKSSAPIIRGHAPRITPKFQRLR